MASASPIAVAVLMLLASSSVGARPHTLTISAPYKGSSWSPYAQTYGGGCGSAHQLKNPFWFKTTGVAGFGISASATKCPKTVGGIGTSANEGAADSFTLSIPLKGFPAGNHTVTANWTMNIQASESALVKGLCPPPPAKSYYTSSTCSASAGVYMGFSSPSGSPALVDLNTGVWLSMNNRWGGYGNSIGNQSYMYNQTYCYSGSCSYSNYSNGAAGGFNGTQTYSFNWSATGSNALNTSHHYVIVITLGANLYADVTSDPLGYPTVHASAIFNLGSATNNWKLNFIQVI